MSKSIANQIVFASILPVESTTVKPLAKMLTHDLKVKNVSGLRKAELVSVAKQLRVKEVVFSEEVNVYGVTLKVLTPLFEKVVISKDSKKIKTTKKAFAVLNSLSDTIVTDVASIMSTGVKLYDIAHSPEKFVQLKHVAAMKEFASKFNPYYVSVGTKENALVWVTEIATAEVKMINDEQVTFVKPYLAIRSQNALLDKLGKKFVTYYTDKRTGEIHIASADLVTKVKAQGEKQEDGSYIFEEVKYQVIRDMRYIVNVDYNLDIPVGENELTLEQRFLRDGAVLNGLYFDFNGRILRAEYFLASASAKRQVMGTHIVGMDAVTALHEIGMDMRQFSKFKGVKYVYDAMKAPTRFGLASTSSLPSTLIKIGKGIKEYEDGSYAIVGGTHTMKVTADIFSYVRSGKYVAYDAENDAMIVLDASEIAFKRNVTDGLVFADASVQQSIFAEFGKLVSSEQVRITPATKGLVVFVPGLKDMVGHDLLAFESATKGDYRTLLRTNPDFEIEFRVAIFGKNAAGDKKKTNVPYQMIQTSNFNIEALKEKLLLELDEAFSIYDNADKLADYLGTRTLDIFDDVSDEDMTEEQRGQIDGTLTSMFTNFFYAGEFVMNDPYFKKRLLDIIENLILAWTRGAMPVNGHYRFMVTDVYGVMEAYLQGSIDAKFRRETDFVEYDEKGKASILVPSYVGIPANHVVMVDDQDEFFLDGKDIIFNRNPKISMKETAKATGIVMKAYYLARKEYSYAFNNLVFFSCHDFNTVKQGGADYDGDKTHASTDPIMLDAFVEQPALLDLTKLYNKKTGEYEFIEGCPWQADLKAEAPYVYSYNGQYRVGIYRSDVFVDGVMINDEFKVSFTDAEYTLDFARQMHELSKVFVLRTLESNRIGELTDYATKLLAAISHLQYCLQNNVVALDPSVKYVPESLTEELRAHYVEQIEYMTFLVDKMRLAQGWEIDRPKHGGAYWNKFHMEFIDDVNEFPIFTSGVYFTPKGKEYKKWHDLEWHRACKTRDSLKLQKGMVFPSVMQELRSFVLVQFNTKVKAEFIKMNPSSDNNNLIKRLAPYANVYNHSTVDRLMKELVSVFDEYAEAQSHIGTLRIRYNAKREATMFRSKHEADVFDAKHKYELDNLLQQAIITARSQVKALSAKTVEGYELDEAAIAYIVYARKYQDYDAKKAKSPAEGLSFPWVICQDGMLELVRRASGKSNAHVRFTNIKAADITVRLTGFAAFGLSGDKVKQLFSTATTAGVKYEYDSIMDTYTPVVYVNNRAVAMIPYDYAHFFTGAHKFIFGFKDFEATAKSGSFKLSLLPEGIASKLGITDRNISVARYYN
jgi:hypothetical protein